MYYVSDYTWCILLNAQPCFFGINNRTTNVDTKRAHNPNVHPHSVSNGKLISLIVMSPKHKIYFLNAKSFVCTLSNTWHVICYIYIIIYISTEFAFFMRPKMIDVQYIAVFVLWTYLCKLQPRSGKRKPAQMSSCCSALLPEAVVL